MKKTDWIVCIVLCLLSIYTLKDLFGPGFYTSHDGPHQVVRLYYFDKLLSDGQFPPRYVDGLLNGYGYPLFIFSYHLPWIIAEPFLKAGFSIFTSIKLTFLVGYMLSGIAMYLFQKQLVGRFPAFVGTVVYLFAPFRFSNIFVRGAIGDATALIFPPILFLSLHALQEGKGSRLTWVLLGAFSLTGLILSHAFVFLFFFGMYAAALVFFLPFSKHVSRFLFTAIAIPVIASGISAYYLIPSFVERELTVFKATMEPLFENTVPLNFTELLYSPWGYGTIQSEEGAMSLQIGFAQWAAGLFGVCTLLYLIVKKYKSRTLPQVVFYIVMFAGAIFLMLPASLPVWKELSSYVVLDFVWRALPVVIFAASVLAGYSIRYLPFSKILATGLIVLAFYANRNHVRVNERLDWSVPFFLELEYTTNTYNEYTPVWVDRKYVGSRRPKVEVFESDIATNIVKANSNYLEFTVDALRKSVVRVNTVYYPGWQLKINGASKQIWPDKRGMMEFDVPKGASRVTMEFHDTPDRMLGNAVSVATLTTIGIVILVSQFKKRLKIT